MNVSKGVLILLFGILLIGNAAALKVSVLEYDPFPAQAGSFVDLFISVENTARGSSQPATIEFVPRDSIRLAFGENAVKSVGIVPGQRSVVAKFRIEITEDAVDGENIFEVKIKEGSGVEESYDLTIEVENEAPHIEIGDVESEPRKILPDSDDVQLTITLLNIGREAAENLKATLVVPQGIEFSDSFSNVSLEGNIAPNSASEAVFFIDIPENTPGGSYPAQLQVQYTRPDSASQEFITRTLDFDLIVKPVARFEVTEVTTTPEVLGAGMRAIQMKLRIANVGEAEADSVRVKVFQKSEQPFEFDNAFDFVAPTLEPGQYGESTLEFRIKDDAPLQKYLLELEIKSFVDDTVRLEKEVIELNVTEPLPSFPDVFLLLGGAIIVVVLIAYFYRRQKRIAAKNKNGRGRK